MMQRTLTAPFAPGALVLGALAVVGLGLGGCGPFGGQCKCAHAYLSCEDAATVPVAELSTEQHTAEVDLVVARLEALAGRWSVPYECPAESLSGSLTIDVSVDAAALRWIVNEPELDENELYDCDAPALGTLTITTGNGPYTSTSQRTLTVKGRAYGEPSATVFSGSARTDDGNAAPTGTLMLVFDEMGVLNGTAGEISPPDCDASGICSQSRTTGCTLSAGSRVGS